MISDSKKSLILFDGICNLCNASVRFIIRYDKKKRFRFLSLQSDAAKETLLHYNYKILDSNTLILIHQGKIYTRSDAILHITRYLHPFWNIFYLLIKFPLKPRDKIYDLIAANRYKWFGKQQKCTLFIPGYKDRFI